MNVINIAALIFLGLCLVPDTGNANHVQEASPVIWETSLEIDQAEIDRIIPPFDHFQICGTMHLRIQPLLKEMDWTPPAPEKKYWVYTVSGTYFYDDYETAVSFAKPGDRIIVDFDRFLTMGDGKIQDFAVLDYEKACSLAGDPEFEKATSMFDVWVIRKGERK
ncbi:MAG: hypothetical protein QF645_00190 [Planctomycetota bacterium]|nr:hypothetical protein [Planctomycetota bacterium]